MKYTKQQIIEAAEIASIDSYHIEALINSLLFSSESPESFIDRFCLNNEINKSELLSKSRFRYLTDYRHCLAYMLHTFLGLANYEIAPLLNRDHAMIVYYIREVQNCKEKRKIYLQCKNRMQ